ncbi:phage tail protein [Yersinia rochesterensis]|uniref:phage tail protein n=1 Tax=Yersinia rochesterensis TaxID=1604335 RepID=UPI001F1D9997|nr:phage tail protein [Yersinia rochesterensis]
MARKDSFNQPWASVPAQFERPGDGLIARGWAGGASEDPPEAKWENWWHNRVDLALQELQNLGQLIWFVDAPYKAGARVNYGGNSFIALSNNTGVEPTGLLDVGVWRKESTKTYLQTANNLSEIKAAGPVAVAQAIDNLGLKDTAATAAGALQKTENLNDVANKKIALTNLGALPANGTAAAATKLATPRTIAGKSFDGTGNITIGAADVGALPIAGGALLGPLAINGTHNEPLGPGGFRSCLLTPTNGGITNPSGVGIGVHSNGTIYFWNDNMGYAASLSPTLMSFSRPVWSTGTITPGDYSNFDERYESSLPGTPIAWPLTTAPSGYLKCNGASFNKTQYPKLALAYPTGVLPDLRGNVMRGWDDGRGIDSGRAILSEQGDAIRNITGAFSVYGAKELSTEYPSWATGAFSVVGVSGKNNVGAGGTATVPQFNFSAASAGVPTANENRMRNIAFNYIVRAL